MSFADKSLRVPVRATRARTSIDGAAVGYVSVHDGYPLDLAAKPSDGGDGGFLSRAYFSEEMMLMQDGGLELSQFCLPGDLTMFFGDHH